MTRPAAALALLALLAGDAGCVQHTARYAYGDVRAALPALRATGHATVGGTLAPAEPLTLDDTLVLGDGDRATPRELAEPCTHAPERGALPGRDTPLCALDVPNGVASRTWVDGWATMRNLAIGTLVLAGYAGLGTCAGVCPDPWNMASGIGLGVALLAGMFWLLSFLGP